MDGNLFAYGTLMCADIILEVAGCCPDHCQGSLRGYSRRSIKGEVYPAIIAEEKSAVDGILYRNISAGAWERLDQFEGKIYSRRSVEITLPGKTVVSAEAYVLRQEFLYILEEKEWDFGNFLLNHKNIFFAQL